MNQDELFKLIYDTEGIGTYHAAQIATIDRALAGEIGYGDMWAIILRQAQEQEQRYARTSDERKR